MEANTIYIDKTWNDISYIHISLTHKTHRLLIAYSRQKHLDIFTYFFFSSQT